MRLAQEALSLGQFIVGAFWQVFFMCSYRSSLDWAAWRPLLLTQVLKSCERCPICQHAMVSDLIKLPCGHRLHRGCGVAQFSHTCLRPATCSQTKMKWKIRDKNVKGRGPASCGCASRACPLCGKKYERRDLAMPTASCRAILVWDGPHSTLTYVVTVETQ